jgi:hypothetical protein
MLYFFGSGFNASLLTNLETYLFVWLLSYQVFKVHLLYENDSRWDGLKGYVTNTKLKDKEVIENYKNLWHMEVAFRMSQR